LLSTHGQNFPYNPYFLSSHLIGLCQREREGGRERMRGREREKERKRGREIERERCPEFF
jgi:hypothetical protein